MFFLKDYKPESSEEQNGFISGFYFALRVAHYWYSMNGYKIVGEEKQIRDFSENKRLNNLLKKWSQPKEVEPEEILMGKPVPWSEVQATV